MRCGAEWCCRACARLRWWRAGSGVPLAVSSPKTSDGLQERPRACDTSRYLSRNGLRHKQVLVQKWPYACTKTGASTGLALFDKQDQVVVGSHGQRASSCRTRGGRAQPGMPGCSSLMSAVPKTSERKRKGSKTGAGALLQNSPSKAHYLILESTRGSGSVVKWYWYWYLRYAARMVLACTLVRCELQETAGF